MSTLPDSPGLNIQALEQTLHPRYLTTSYKLYWFSALLNEVAINPACNSVPFTRMVARMVAIAWYPIVQFRLFFGVYDQLQELVDYLRRHDEFSQVRSQDENVRMIEKRLPVDAELRQRIEWFFRFVPFRFLTPFYAGQLVRLPDHQRNRRIAELADDDHGVYRIRQSEIVMNPLWLEYLYRNNAILKGWSQHKLTLYLQQRNPNVPGVAMKINAPNPSDRGLSKATQFWQRIMESKSLTDIYTGTPITPDNFARYGSFSVDHFIPWSFVLHNQLWNLVPSFQRINSSKSDRLPDLSRYFEPFCRMQHEAYTTAIEWPDGAKKLEDYGYKRIFPTSFGYFGYLMPGKDDKNSYKDVPELKKQMKKMPPEVVVLQLFRLYQVHL